MEAMASGRPVVATDVGDVSSLVDHGTTGFLVPNDDNEAQALTTYISRLAADPDLCRRMGEAGRGKARKEFGLDRLAEDTLSAYRSAGWSDNIMRR